MKRILGRHRLIEYFNCDPEILNSPTKLKKALVRAALKGNATVITSVFHRFAPHGVSGIVVIAESHISIHTWPEFQCATVDIFSCSLKLKIHVIASEIRKALKPAGFSTRELQRTVPKTRKKQR